jgi:hypothetical protein
MADRDTQRHVGVWMHDRVALGLSCGESKSQCINANLYTSMGEAVILAVVEAVAKEREHIGKEHYANCIEIGK